MTTYRLAVEEDDLARARELFQEEGYKDAPEYPTIIAEKDGVVTGALTTHIDNDRIIAGPLALKPGAPRYWTLIRLIEAYDHVMRGIGITRYIFSVPEDRVQYLDQIDKIFHLEPYAIKDGIRFFERTL